MAHVWLQLCMNLKSISMKKVAGMKNDDKIQSLQTASFKSKLISSTSSIGDKLSRLVKNSQRGWVIIHNLISAIFSSRYFWLIFKHLLDMVSFYWWSYLQNNFYVYCGEQHFHWHQKHHRMIDVGYGFFNSKSLWKLSATIIFTVKYIHVICWKFPLCNDWNNSPNRSNVTINIIAAEIAQLEIFIFAPREFWRENSTK